MNGLPSSTSVNVDGNVPLSLVSQLFHWQGAGILILARPPTLPGQGCKHSCHGLSPSFSMPGLAAILTYHAVAHLDACFSSSAKALMCSSSDWQASPDQLCATRWCSVWDVPPQDKLALVHPFRGMNIQIMLCKPTNFLTFGILSWKKQRKTLLATSGRSSEALQPWISLWNLESGGMDPSQISTVM